MILCLGKDKFGKDGLYQVILKRVELPVIPRDEVTIIQYDKKKTIQIIKFLPFSFTSSAKSNCVKLALEDTLSWTQASFVQVNIDRESKLKKFSI